LKAVGLQYTYDVTDYVSGKSVSDVLISRGEATTRSDKKGKAVLTIPTDDDTQDDVKISSKDYRTETQSLPEDAEVVTKLTLVPKAHEVFVSKASGKYDVYRMYADGKDKEVILPGTGLEGADIAVLAAPNDGQAAVVSTRDNKRNKDGFLLSTLSIVTIADGGVETVDHAERFQLIGWRDNTLIYSQTAAGASAANPNREKITAYDVESGKRYQLATANQFGQSFLIGSKLYYTVMGTDPGSNGQFAVINLDGSGKRTLYDGSVWSVVRTTYDNFLLQSPDNKWHSYTLGGTATKDGAAPTDYRSKNYVDAPDLDTAAFIDVRDSNGALVKRDLSTNKETDVLSQKGAVTVVRWLNSKTVVIRVITGSESADYAASTDGGKAKLITEVTTSPNL
jgi:hypothetical protein